MSAVIAGAVVGALPFAFSFSIASTVSVNGVVTGTYRDYFAFAAGIVAIACGGIGAIAAPRPRKANMLGLAVLVVVLGAFQLARGFGVFHDHVQETTRGTLPSPPPSPGTRVAPTPERCIDGHTCFELGERLGETAPARAAIAYERACDFKVPGGCINAAIALESKSDLAKAATLNARACELGAHRGCANLGVALLLGEGVPIDLVRARRLLVEACQHEDPIGCRNAAVIYRDGLGVDKDLTQTRELVTRACEFGDHEEAGACEDAGAMFLAGPAKNVKRAASYFERACTLEPAHCFNLAVATADGLVGARDPATARRLYEKACAAGRSTACNNLGDLLRQGIGGAKDVVTARKLFQQACDAGLELGCRNLK
jgi:TPR repeat protein